MRTRMKGSSQSSWQWSFWGRNTRHLCVQTWAPIASVTSASLQRGSVTKDEARTPCCQTSDMPFVGTATGYCQWSLYNISQTWGDWFRSRLARSCSATHEGYSGHTWMNTSCCPVYPLPAIKPHRFDSGAPGRCPRSLKSATRCEHERRNWSRSAARRHQKAIPPIPAHPQRMSQLRRHKFNLLFHN